tara:strand:+ start:1161 stop:2234 length:1074 start_codon:yes stop_codon:yes gene_type:complete
MVAHPKPSPERAKQISLAMKPFRTIRKKRHSLVLQQESISLKMAHSMMESKTLCNSKQNRNPVWSVSKSQSFIFALFVSRTAPTDFLVRETEAEEEEEPELHIFDGCNRLTAIYKFFECEFPIMFGSTNVYYHELPTTDRCTFDRTLCQFTKLRNCPEYYACEIAEKRNEGTPMTIGEKTNLLISVGTPRSGVLERIMNVAPYMELADDRASGLKVVAQLVQSIEMKRGVESHAFKLTDYHFDFMRTFYKSDEELCYINAKMLIKAFETVGDICEDGKMPETLRDQMAVLKNKKAPAKVGYFYLAVISAVVDNVRNNTQITEKMLLSKFKLLCDRSLEAKSLGRTFCLGGSAIDDMY